MSTEFPASGATPSAELARGGERTQRQPCERSAGGAQRPRTRQLAAEAPTARRVGTTVTHVPPVAGHIQIYMCVYSDEHQGSVITSAWTYRLA